MKDGSIKCEYSRCKNPVAYECKKLWGKGGTIYTCEEHRPGSRRDELPPEHPIHAMPSFYDVQPVQA